MSAIATDREVRWPASRSRRQAVWAVIAATVVTGLAVFAVEWPLIALRLLPNTGDLIQTGWGWPWRVDGAWSLVADAGPLAAGGLVFAFVVARVRYRPIDLRIAAAAAGAFALTAGYGGEGSVAVVAFLVLVVLARRGAVRRWDWTRGRVVAVVVAAIVLAAVTLSYGQLHPLVARASGLTDGLSAKLVNEGRLPVVILGVDVPGQPGAIARTDNEAVREASDPDDLKRPLAGASLAPGADRWAYVRVPRRSCVEGYPVARVIVRMRVAGREVRQSVALAPDLRVSC